MATHFIKSKTRVQIDQKFEEYYGKDSNSRTKMLNQISTFNEIELLNETDENKETKFILISDFDFIAKNEIATFATNSEIQRYFLLDISSQHKQIENAAYYNLPLTLKDHTLAAAFQKKVKQQIATYKTPKRKNFKVQKFYSKPYTDWSGAGELMSFGYPVFYHSPKESKAFNNSLESFEIETPLYGLVTTDITVLTVGSGNSPLSESLFFNRGTKSYIMIFDYKTGLVLQHPRKPVSTEFLLDIHELEIEKEVIEIIDCVQNQSQSEPSNFNTNLVSSTCGIELIDKGTCLDENTKFVCQHGKYTYTWEVRQARVI